MAESENKGENNCAIYRNKKGRFITKRKNEWLTNLANRNAKRKHVNDNENNKKFCIIEGNRFMELDTLAAELWCKKCDIPLSLRDIVSETNHCLASTFEVVCQRCKNKHRVNTCKQSPNGRSRYQINSDIISGMKKAGVELNAFNRFLTSMDIPKIKPSKLKKYEEELADVNNIDTTESTEEAIEMKESIDINVTESAKEAINTEELIYTDAIENVEEAIEIEESTTFTVEQTQK